MGHAMNVFYFGRKEKPDGEKVYDIPLWHFSNYGRKTKKNNIIGRLFALSHTNGTWKEGA